MLCVQLGCEKRFNVEFLGADTSVTLLTSRDLAWSSGRLTCKHASQISSVAHVLPVNWYRGYGDTTPSHLGRKLAGPL